MKSTNKFRTLIFALIVLFGVILPLVFLVFFIHARNAAIKFMTPLSDLVSYKSCYIIPLGTSGRSPSFLFQFFPKGTDSHYAIFYVETSVGGEIKKFTGPFTDGKSLAPETVRPYILN